MTFGLMMRIYGDEGELAEIFDYIHKTGMDEDSDFVEIIKIEDNDSYRITMAAGVFNAMSKALDITDMKGEEIRV